MREKLTKDNKIVKELNKLVSTTTFYYFSIMTRRTYLMLNILLLYGKFLIIMQIDPFG